VIVLLGLWERVQEVILRQVAVTYGPEAAAGVVLVPEQQGLQGLAAQYQSTRQQLEDLLDEYQIRLARGKKVQLHKVRGGSGCMQGGVGSVKVGCAPLHHAAAVVCL
jgi:hypothetical protein